MRFHPFGLDHKIVLGITLGVAALLVASAKSLRRRPDDKTLRRVIALGLTATGIVSWAYDYLIRGFPGLPLQLCDLALVCVIWALWRPGDRLSGELAYFWALGGSFQAILTPDLIQGFPSLPWILFFLLHCGVVLGAVYLMVRGHLRLAPGSVWRVFLITNVYAGVAGLANLALGTNFGYLAAKPARPSVLDYLGPWPVYILGMEALALAAFCLLYGFAWWVEKKTVKYGT